MALFKTIAEGGQIWAHRLRMFKQVIRIALLISALSGVGFLGCRLTRIPKLHYQAAWYYALAELQVSPNESISVDSEFWWEIARQRGSGGAVLIKAEKLQKTCERKLALFQLEIVRALNLAFSFSLMVCGGSILFFLVKGLRSRQKEHIEGRKAASSWRVAWQLKLTRKASSLKLGQLPLVKGAETRHILISGGTGTGKTNCFYHLLPQIRESGQRAVVVDTTGEFVSRYFREGRDVLLNPSDKRGVSWHPWIECADSYDYKSLAQSFIPSSYREEENFWRRAAQEVFCSILQIGEAEKRLSRITELILYTPLPKLYQALQETKAASFLDLSSEKTAASIRAVAASFLECLELFNDTETPFSIRNWINYEKDDGWLFLASSVRQRASLNPLLSAWFSIAMQSLIQMEPSHHRRLWFIADELPSLQRLKDLETCLTESRKFGGCALLALQSPAQLEIVYGREMAKVIVGNCATRIAFAEQDPEIAARISKGFGEKETKEFQEAISYGAHEMRDGVNLSFQNKTSPVVSATKLQSLNVNEAFVKLPGNLPITKIRLKYRTHNARV